MIILGPRASIATLLLFTLLGAACGGGGGGDDGGGGTKSCLVAYQAGCEKGQVCEDVDGRMPACFAAISFQGKVFGALDRKPVAGARVVARDASDAVVSTVAITKEDGTYTLVVPAKRDANGAPVEVKYTLRADASGFQTFPTAPRVALPVSVTTATGDPKVVRSAATDIALLPLPNKDDLGSITGMVTADHPGGVLVVAGNATGVADAKGAYEVFNVPASASVEVRGYAAGLQFKPASAAVTAGMRTKDVNLASSGEATADVSGKIDIVNGGTGTTTSVVLAVESTFVASAARGEVPKGLRVGNITSDFVIKGVPDGKYVVLAAFENDDLVRDPDTSIGGTQIVHITVAGRSQAIATSFKVTGALRVVSPGASMLEEVSGKPSFVWGDDSSEKSYQLRVFDAFGNTVWENLMIPSVSGSATVTAPYGGPALKEGMIYQFRATSIKQSGSAIATTEDLRGVFSYK
jgi:hypothetical protein